MVKVFKLLRKVFRRRSKRKASISSCIIDASMIGIAVGVKIANEKHELQEWAHMIGDRWIKWLKEIEKSRGGGK